MNDYCFVFVLDVTCAVPATVAHSLLAPVADPYLYNTTVTYTCNIGYENTGGSLSRTCEANGAFSGTAPVCSSKFYHAAKNIENIVKLR